MIPYGRQGINQADIDAVVAVLRSDYLTQGPIVPAFEQALAEYCGAEHAVAVNSATSALHLACLALGVGKGDVVWTTPISFVASANCALYCGATVDFVDIDANTYNLSVEDLEVKLVAAERVGTLPKVLIPVHMCGQSCDMAAISVLGKKYGFKIIEDASHAIGGRYKGELIGNCQHSDVTVFSFHPVKIITTGEGGMAVTNDDQIARRLRLLRSHGITSTSAEMEERPSDEIWNYQQIDLGFNYRMTDMQAALGMSQLQRIDEFVRRRHSIANYYDQALSRLPLQLPWQHTDSYSSYHLYVVRLRLSEIGRTQRDVFEGLHAAGILVNLHYIPIYRQPYYRKMGFGFGYCPRAECYYREALSIPMYPRLTKEAQELVVESIKSVLFL